MAENRVTVVIDARAKDAIATFNKVGNDFVTLGNRMEQVGRTLSVAVTAPIVGLGAVATRELVKYDTALTGVAKTVDASEERIQQIGESFRHLAENEIPLASTELLKLAQVGGQLGIAVSHLESFAQTAAAMGVATDLSAEEAAVALARLARITAFPQERLDALGSVVVRLGNNLATTESQILDMALRMAGVAKVVDVPQAAIIGFAGALSELGERSQAGGTAVQRMFQNMAVAVTKGGAELEQFAQIANMTVEEFVTLFEEDATEAAVRFVEGLGQIEGGSGRVFQALRGVGLQNVRVSRGLIKLSTSGERLREVLEMAGDEMERNTALADEAERFFNRLGARFIFLREKARNVAIDIGRSLEPQIRLTTDSASNLLDVVRGLVQAFGSLPVPVRGLATAMVGLVAAIGPLALGLSALAKGFGFVRTGLVLLKPVLLANITLMGTLSALVNPTGLLIIGLTAVAAALTTVALKAGEAEDKIGGLRNSFDEAFAESSKEFVLGALDATDQAIQETEDRIEKLKGNRMVDVGLAAGARGDSPALAAQEEQLAQLRTQYDALINRLAALNQEHRDNIEREKNIREVRNLSAAAMDRYSIAIDNHREAWREAMKQQDNARDKMKELRVEALRVAREIELTDPTSDRFEELAEQLEEIQAELRAMEVTMKAAGDVAEQQFRRMWFGAKALERLLQDIQSGDLLARQEFGFLGQVEPVAAPHETIKEANEILRVAQQFKRAGRMDELTLEAVRMQLEKVGLTSEEVERALASLNRTGTLTANKLEQAGQVAISAMGAMAQAVIRDMDFMTESVILGFTQIAQAAATQFIGGTAGAVVGAIGGIAAALFGNNNKPQPVRVDDFSSRAERKMNGRSGPDTVILQIRSPTTGELIDQVEYQLNRRARRDATARIPGGVSFGGGS